MSNTIIKKPSAVKAGSGKTFGLMLAAIMALAVAARAQVSDFADFRSKIAAYAKAGGDVEIVVAGGFTAGSSVNIPKPQTAGAVLTIRSADPAAPATLTRGASGNFFSVADGAALVLKNIIIDGGGASADSANGTLVRVGKGGTLVVGGGAVLRNNVNPNNGGGVHVLGGAAFTMDGGEITGNSAGKGGGVYIGGDGAFTMQGGKIDGNSAETGGGVDVRGAFTMAGGEIIGNSAGEGGGGGVHVTSAAAAVAMTGGKISGNTTASANVWGGGGGVRVFGSTFTMAGGEISGNAAVSSDGNDVCLVNSQAFNAVFAMTGGVLAGAGRGADGFIRGRYDFNAGAPPAPNNGVIIAWSRPPAAQKPRIHGTAANLTVLPKGSAEAVWELRGGRLGISYKHGANTGFIDISAVNPVPVVDGVLTDPRDGRKYRTVKIGGQTWMAENLNYAIDSSRCYDGDTAYCEKYGRLYAWTAASAACPAGWHLPHDDDWQALIDSAGGSPAVKLKAKTGWDSHPSGAFAGTDDYGFSALPGGFGYNKGRDHRSDNAGGFGYWWSGTEWERPANPRPYQLRSAWYRIMTYGHDSVYRSYRSIKDVGFSVRCVQE